jgi:hypothetical protein
MKIGWIDIYSLLLTSLLLGTGWIDIYSLLLTSLLLGITWSTLVLHN